MALGGTWRCGTPRATGTWRKGAIKPSADALPPLFASSPPRQERSRQRLLRWSQDKRADPIPPP